MNYDIIEITDCSDRGVFDAIERLLPQLNDSLSLSYEEFADVIKSPASHLFVANSTDGEIAGVIALGIYRTLSGCKAWIEDVIVDSAHRGNGLGRLLVGHAIDYAKSNGADTVMLTSNPKREAANALYQKMGFSKRETNLYILPLD